MAVTTTKTNKPLNPRGNDQSPLAYNRAKLYSGKALDFDGVNDVVNITTDDVDLQEFSVVQYVNLGATAASKIFYSNYAPTGNLGFATGISDSTANVPKFYTKGTSSDTLFGSFALNAGEWYQIVATYDGATKKIYVNGVLDTSVAFSDTILYTNATNQIGALSGSTAQALDGQLSNTKIFNTALTAAQVADLYNNPEKVVPTGVDNTALKLWLPMMEGAGTTAYDGSGNGNHGTISGATYVNGVGSPVAQSAVMDWNKLYDFDGVDDKAYNASYQDTTGTKAYKVHFIAHDVNTEGQIFQLLNFSASKGVGATIDFLGTNNGTLGMRGFVSNSDYNIQSWNVEANTYYELAFTIDWDTDTITSATLNGETATGSVSARIDTSIGGLFLGGRNTQFYLNGIINYFEVVGEEKWTNASGFKSESGSYDMTITGSPTQILAPQGLTSGRDITGVNLFENVRKQGALNLDGNSWAEVHDNASVDLTTSLSLEVWCYPTEDGTSSGREIIGKFISGSSPYQCYALQYEPGKFGFGIGATDNTWEVIGSTTGKAKENWYHVVATYDGATRKIYINGVQDASGNYTKTPQTTDENIAIGRWLGQAVGGNNTFFGPIAQPRIYNRALTAEEVQRNYNAGKNTYTN